jgi:anaerobic magnesium-protoporphyrin IX monomethyl ester cyclase
MKKNTEIIFLYPNIHNGNLDYSLGANYIIAYLRQRGFYATQFVNKLALSLKDLTKEILSLTSRSVGFTCYDSNYFLVKLLAQSIKKMSPKTLILAGGPTATFSDMFILNDIPEVDICVRGEGEQTTHELIKQLKNDKNLSGVAGISFREGKRIIQTSPRTFMTKCKENNTNQLDIIPSPYISGILNPAKIEAHNNDLTILTARGCFHHCTYCSFSAISQHTIRYHSVDRVISELMIIKSKIKNPSAMIYIQDDAFTLNKIRAKEICRKIIKERLGLSFWIQTRADCVDRELIELLAKAGVKKMNFGLESASPKVLYKIKKVRSQYGKNDNLEPEKNYIKKIREGVDFAKNAGILTSVSVIFGLPKETFKDALRTFNFIKSLKLPYYYDNELVVYPGTELFSLLRKPINQNNRTDLLSFDYNPKFNLNKIPKIKGALNIIRENIRVKKMMLFANCFLMGIYNARKQTVPIQDIILINKTLPLNWLKEIAPLQARIFFMNYSKKDKLTPHHLKRFDISIKGYAYENFIERCLYSEANKKIKLPYALLPLNKNYKFNKLTGEDLTNRKIIFDLSSAEGLMSLERYMALSARVAKNENNSTNKTNYLFMDYCRFGNSCPGAKLTRFFVNENGEVLPCLKAKPIGRIGDKLEALQQKLTDLKKNTELRRKCSYCQVRNTCSKCLFLGSLEERNYCRIQKQHHHRLTKYLGEIELGIIADFITKSKEAWPF